MGVHMIHGDAQHLQRAVQGAENWNNSGKYVEIRADVPKDDKWCRAVYDTCQDDEDKEVATQICDAVRSHSFNFHSIRLITITKVKTKRRQKIDTC